MSVTYFVSNIKFPVSSNFLTFTASHRQQMCKKKIEYIQHIYNTKYFVPKLYSLEYKLNI